MLVVPHLTRLSRFYRWGHRSCSRRLLATCTVFVSGQSICSQYGSTYYSRKYRMCQEIGICLHQLRAGGSNPGRRIFCGVTYSFFVDATFFATCLKMCTDMIQESSAQTRRQFYMLPLLLYYEFCQLPLSAVVLLWGKYGCIRGVETGVSPPSRIPLIHL